MSLVGKTFTVTQMIIFRNNQFIRSEGDMPASTIHVGSSGKIVRETPSEVLVEIYSNPTGIPGQGRDASCWIKRGSIANYLKYT